MSNYNFYIENYFIENHFKNMKMDSVVRNYVLEENVKNAAEVEFVLFDLLLKNQLEEIIPRKGKTISGDSYEIPEKILPGYIISFNDNLAKDADLFDLFNFGRHRIQQKVPLIDLFCKIKRLDINVAVEELRKILYKNGWFDIEIAYPTQYMLESLPKNTIHSNIIHDYEEPNQSVMYSYYVKYLDRGKVLIPFGYTYNQQFPVLFYYQLFNKKTSFFNETFLNNNPNAVVILTDSIELASRNQTYINSIDIEDIVWLAFDDKNCEISNLDWKLLKGRNIYYLLKEHSGFGTEKVFSTASAISRELRLIRNKKFSYISLLANYCSKKEQSRFVEKIPIILTEKELELKKYESCKIMHNFSEFKNDLSQIISNEKPLLAPLIYKKSKSFIYASQNINLSLFGLHLGFSISQGCSAFQGWRAGELGITVLYLKGLERMLFFTQDLRDILKLHSFMPQKEDFYENYLLTNPDTPKPFPVEKTSYEQNFFLNIFDINNSENVINFVNSQISIIEKKNVGDKILIIDGLLDNILNNNLDRTLIFFKILISRLYQNNWAIIILSNRRSNLTTEIYFDSIVKISRRRTNADFSAKIKIEKSYIRLDRADREFSCEARLSSEPLKFIRKRISSEKKSDWLLVPREKLIMKINNLSAAGSRIKDIAKDLEISESLVKKLKFKKYRFEKINKS